MSAGSSTESGVLDPHVPPDEELQASKINQSGAVAVTDRRVLSVSEGGGGNRETREVESVLLTADCVLGTQYSRTDSENRGTLQRLVGAAVAVVGLLMLLGALLVSGTAQAVLAMFGLLALVIGILVYWMAEDTVEGGVSITVRRGGEVPDRTWRFPRGETDVPHAISRQVAKIHGPE